MDVHYEVSSALPHADVQRLAAAAAGALLPVWVEFRDPVPGGTRLTLTITGVASNWNVVSAWITEDGSNGQPHAGGATFYTSSVQKSTVDSLVRIIGSHDWGSPLHVGAMLILGQS